ncbi:hypothetical protein N9K30_04680, partial [Planktomarina temperata]|nr:hypothetical protein [Planktomarina temperata]
LKEKRRFREYLMQSNLPHHRKILKSLDFYSLSEVTDLLYHVQEHRFTIPQIQSTLDYLNLEFCGFDNTRTLLKFQAMFPDSVDLYNLDKWHEFEVAYPDTFSRMYQFWCQKRA